MSHTARISSSTKLLAALSTIVAINAQLTGCADKKMAPPVAPKDGQSGGTQQTSTTSTEAIPGAPLGNPCLLQPAFLEKALAPVLGAITVTPEHRTAESDDEKCRYLIDGADAVIDLYSHRYRDGRELGQGVYNVDRRYGGYTPAEVYSSTVTAFQDVGEAAGDPGPVATYPNIAGGMVTDSNNAMVLAGTGNYWFTFDLSGGPYPAVINDAFVQIGDALSRFQ